MVQSAVRTPDRPIRVVFADDSAAVRRLLTDGMNAHASFQVVGAARHGQEAVEMVRSLTPDIVMLDVEMPVMDGIDATRMIRKLNASLPILMFSSLTRQGGEATLDALSVGANDYIPKPTSTTSVKQVSDYLETNVFPKLRGLAMDRMIQKTDGGTLSVPPPRSVAKRISRPECIVIGSSTGGPNALAELLTKMPARLTVPVLIVQHMPSMFTNLLADRLQQITPFDVREAKQGDIPEPGLVLIAPGDQHMELVRRPGGPGIRLHQGPEENSCRPAVDVLFRSAADVYGERTLAVVLTGMGRDGVNGCQALHERGAGIFVQDQASSVIWGMPRAVKEAGYADSVLSLRELPAAIQRTLSLSSQIPTTELIGSTKQP